MKPRRHKFGMMMTLTGLLICAALTAQSPEKMSYQAVVRDAGGVLLSNQNIGIRIQILQTSEFGAAVFVETHTRPTNANGLLTLEIGGGTVVMGSFTGINWSAGPYFLKTEIDPAGGTSYSIIGTTQLLSVPYALQAKSVTTEADPVFTVSPAAAITGTNITNWNTAFGWGNHSGLYRSVSWVPSWADVILKPSEFPPSLHLHSTYDISSGTLPVVRGGTGAATFNPGNVLIGSGTGTIATLSRTGIDTRADFPPSAHYHQATDITSGTLAVARGGTGISSYTTANYLRASGATFLEQRTPAQVLADIGAAEAFHTHGSITGDGKIGTNAGRIITTGTGGTLQATAGNTAGEMLYWNGSAWINVAPGETGQVLTLVNGVPTWIGTRVETNDVINPATGKIWMDRNLGASQIATSSTDVAAYGDLYQWGRGKDGHQIRTSGTTATLSNSDTPGHGIFIVATISPWDWRSPQNDNLWQGGGINNPCPSHYRLPTEAEWNAELLSWSTSNSSGAFTSPLKLPAAGYRLYSTGSLTSVGSYGYYWSSTINSAYSSLLRFYSTGATMNYYGRAHGNSVRCIKDY